MIKLACMTLPYAAFHFERALQGIAAAGYRYIAFGLPHEGKPVPDEQGVDEAGTIRSLLERYGLQPVMLVGTEQLAPGQPIERAVRLMKFAKALGIGEIISLGTWSYRHFPDDPFADAEMDKPNRDFVEKFRLIGKEAEKFGITITIKPHTGNTATAAHMQTTLEQIGSDAVQACYDPGNVRYYEGIDPLHDFPLIATRTVSMIAKDHKGDRANVDFPIPGNGDVNFPGLLRTWKEKRDSGVIVIERVDGTCAGPLTPEEIDERLHTARFQLERMTQEAGFKTD